jgi:hypothetical protein
VATGPPVDSICERFGTIVVSARNNFAGHLVYGLWRQIHETVFRRAAPDRRGVVFTQAVEFLGPCENDVTYTLNRRVSKEDMKEIVVETTGESITNYARTLI